MTADQLTMLAPRQRQVMELRLAGVSQEDAAEKLGLTLNTVRVME